MEWVSRIVTVGLEMVLPGLLGAWLDHRWGSSPWLMVAGFGFGIVGGIWHLIVLTAS